MALFNSITQKSQSASIFQTKMSNVYLLEVNETLKEFEMSFSSSSSLSVAESVLDDPLNHDQFELKEMYVNICCCIEAC